MFITSTHNKCRKTLKARLFNSLTPNLLPQNVRTQYRLKDNGEILLPFLPIRYCSVMRNTQPWEWWARYCGLSSSSTSCGDQSLLYWHNIRLSLFRRPGWLVTYPLWGCGELKLSLGAYDTGLMTGPLLALPGAAENGRAILFMAVLGANEYLGWLDADASESWVWRNTQCKCNTMQFKSCTHTSGTAPHINAQSQTRF